MYREAVKRLGLSIWPEQFCRLGFGRKYKSTTHFTDWKKRIQISCNTWWLPNLRGEKRPFMPLWFWVTKSKDWSKLSGSSKPIFSLDAGMLQILYSISSWTCPVRDPGPSGRSEYLHWLALFFTRSFWKVGPNLSPFHHHPFTGQVIFLFYNLKS